MSRYEDWVDLLNAPPGSAGPYGSSSRDWAQATSTPAQAAVSPLSSAEDEVNQDQTVTRWRVHLYPGAPVTAASRVVWRGKTFDVDGDVEEHTHSGALDHIELVMRRITTDN